MPGAQTTSAIALYKSETLSLKQAAKASGVSTDEFKSLISEP